MQRLPPEGFEGGPGAGPELAGLGLEVRTIDVVPHQGVSGMGEMDPDLMGAASFEPASKQSGNRLAVPAVERVPDLPVGNGLAAARAHGHLLARMRVAIDRSVDRALPAVWRAPDKGQIASLQCAGASVVGELCAQRLMRGIVLRGDHQSGRVLVEPMDDAGTADAADTRQAGATVGDQGVNQRPGLVARRGVNHQSLGLVDDDEIFVLVDDVERDGFAFRLGGPRRRHVDYDRIPGVDMISGVANGGRIVRSRCSRDVSGSGFTYENLARENERLQPRSRQLGDVNREDSVKARRSLVAGDDDFVPLTAIR